jgi:hypothetical protein
VAARRKVYYYLTTFNAVVTTNGREHGRQSRERCPQKGCGARMRGAFQMMVRGLLTVVVMIGLALTAGPAYAQSRVSGGLRSGLAAPIRVQASAIAGQSPLDHHEVTATYVVKADIDGHSILTLWGRSARWFHISYAAPGRHNGMNDPTIINGMKWFPTWPHPGENYNCHCHSSTFRNVMPPVPKMANSFFFEAVSCRDTCSGKYSDGVLVIDFNDNPSPGDAWYTVKITLTGVCAPVGKELGGRQVLARE